MILTCRELHEAKNNPKINEITLDLLREYYESYLYPYLFKYEINKKGEVSSNIIDLRFDKENFCHLLGIETIVSRTVSRKDIDLYKGNTGWRNVVNHTLTLDFLRQKPRKGQFKDNKSKFVFFYLIPQLIASPKAVLFDSNIINGRTKIDCEILFYDKLQSAHIHIGIKKDEKLGYYIPKTFLIERITQHNNGEKYIQNQDEVTVKKIELRN